MYLTLLKLLSPYLQRLAARKIAEAVQQRRERRLQPVPEATAAPEITLENDLPPPLSSSTNEATEVVTQNAFWFVLSGVVLGSALGIAIAQLMNRQK